MIDGTRGIIEISGPESKDFIQRVFTNNVDAIYESKIAQQRKLKDLEAEAVANALQTPSSQYSLILTPQGRVVYDFFIIKVDDERFMLSAPSNYVEDIVSKLRMHKMRAKINITHLENYIMLRSPDIKETINELKNSNSYDGLGSAEVLAVSHDPRDDRFGDYAIVNFASSEEVSILQAEQCGPHLNSGGEGRSENSCNKNNDSESSGRDKSNCYNKKFALLHFELKIPLFGHDFLPEQMFPFEVNLDSGLARSKGCYIGQEVVTRVRSQGVIRKQVVQLEIKKVLNSGSKPVNIAEADISQGSKIFLGPELDGSDSDVAKARSIGKALGTYHVRERTFLLALMKKDYICEKANFIVQGGAGSEYISHLSHSF